MSTTLFKQSTADTRRHDAVNNTLVEKVWHDLDGQVSREQIRHVITEIAV